ncbi:mitotic checkpoint protein-domain-containing protein [Gongronella butleri]|nr:mitotic checkpoint protein-domain-containing protein [Gongronella butleri]
MDLTKKRDMSESTSAQGAKRPKVTRELLFDPISESTDLQELSGSDDADKLARLKCRIRQLEYHFRQAQGKCDAYEVQLHQSADLYRKEIDELAKAKADADTRAIYQYKEADAAKKALALIKTDHQAVTDRLNKQIESLKQQHKEDMEKARADSYTRGNTELSLNSQVASMSATIASLQASHTQHTQQIEAQHRKIQEGIDRECALRSKLQEAENQLMEMNEAQIDAKTFKQQLKAHDDAQRLEAENMVLKEELRHFKEMYHGIELLREEKHTLQEQLRDLDKIRAENLRLDLENTRLKKERLEWSGFLDKTDDAEVETPRGIIYKLSKEREAARLLPSAHTKYKAELETRDKLIAQLEAHVAELKTSLIEKERVHRADLMTMDLLEKDKQLVRKHVVMLENELKLYDVEEANRMENYEAQKSQRIADLEGLLAEMEIRLSQHALELIKHQQDAPLTPSTATEPGPYVELTSGKSILAFLKEVAKTRDDWEQEKNALHCEVNMQAKALNASKQQLKLLQDTIDRRQFDTEAAAVATHAARVAPTSAEAMDVDAPHESHEPQERILEFKDNPAAKEYAVTKKRVDELREENAQLLVLLERYQGADTSSNAIDTLTVPKSALNNLNQQIAFLEETITKRDKRIDRIQQVWDRKIGLYMEAVANVLGYRLTIFDGGKVRLVSTYADEADLSFQITSLTENNGYVQVMGRRKNEYMKTLQASYDTFIKHRNSVPGFLCSTALELMDRQVETYDPTHTQDFDHHEYIEEDPLVDSQGHELVQPEAIDRESALDESFKDAADDSGDDDYVSYDEDQGADDGYDGDRLQFMVDDDDEGVQTHQGDDDSDDADDNDRIRYQEHAMAADYNPYQQVHSRRNLLATRHYDENENDEEDDENDDMDDELDDEMDTHGEYDQVEYDSEDMDEDDGDNDDDEEHQGMQKSDPIVLDDDDD